MLSSMDMRIPAIVVEAGWFIGNIVAIDYCVKTWGASKILLWTFASMSLVCISIALPLIAGIVHQCVFRTLRSLIAPGVLSTQAAIFAVAWWTIWKRTPSARGWGVAASMTLILSSFFTIWSRVHRTRSIRACAGTLMAVGVIGLVAFLRHDGRDDPGKDRTDP
jgi:hypothetical protein